MNQSTKWPYRWDLLLRYRLIEIISLWEGRLTTKTLTQAFGIGRQQASKDINHYIKQIAPANLVYDTALKGYTPTEQFAPVLTKGEISEYLHLINANQQLVNQQPVTQQVAIRPSKKLSAEDLPVPERRLAQQPIIDQCQSIDQQQTTTQKLSAPSRHIKPEIIRPIIQAARENKRVDIRYLSMTSSAPKERIISPHTIVNNGHRWHVRAYCELQQGFRDFVLSRISEVFDLEGKAESGREQDKAWVTIVDIVITPDPRLNIHQRAVIAIDYGMVNQQKTYNVRGALVTYFLQLLNLDYQTPHPNPNVQQIVVVNHQQIAPWRF